LQGKNFDHDLLILMPFDSVLSEAK